jgi:nitrogen fixation/metabolism regulation signal transduction histidine kinase
VAFANAFNKALDDLVKLRKRLAVTERIAARREIARRVAHEIKNPLAPIRAAVETLRRLRARSDPAFDDYFDEATKTVLSEVHRITKIVSEFTEFARLPAPHPTSVDIEEVAKSTVALYAAGGAEVSLQAWSCPIIQADRDQIVQVLTNLIQNGLDATAGKGSKVDVRIEPVPEGRVAIRIADNGPGVSEEMLPKLFLPYATSKPSGTGLGLAIVQRIVHEHGGEITYEKGTSGGAVFRVVLPVAGPTLPVTSLEETPESHPEPRG